MMGLGPFKEVTPESLLSFSLHCEDAVRRWPSARQEEGSYQKIISQYLYLRSKLPEL